MEVYYYILIVIVIAVVALCVIRHCCRVCRSSKQKDILPRHVDTSNHSSSAGNFCAQSSPPRQHFERRTLNLHGCRSQEAREKLKSFLDEASNAYRVGRGNRYANIITGWGKHSQGAPVIKPLTEEYLDDNGYRYELGSHGGMFVVDLASY